MHSLASSHVCLIAAYTPTTNYCTSGYIQLAVGSRLRLRLCIPDNLLLLCDIHIC